MCNPSEDALADLTMREIKFRDSLQRARTMRQKETDEQSRSCENSLLTIGTILILRCIYIGFLFCCRTDEYNPPKENCPSNNF